MFHGKMIILVIILISGQLTSESKSTHCSYTINVPRCPSDNNTSDDGALSNEQEQLRLLTATLLEMKERQAEMKETQLEMQERLDQTSQTGTSYIRWGRTLCPDTAVRLYDGYVAKSKHDHTGGGVDYICLHSEPELPQGSASASGLPATSKITGVEYQYIFQHQALLDSDALCAACIVHGRSQQMMIPGRLTCDDGWTKEYSGVLASDHHAYKKASYVCLDADPETFPGSAANLNGGLFYSVEIECAYAAFCPPYVDGNVLFCVVCTM